MTREESMEPTPRIVVTDLRTDITNGLWMERDWFDRPLSGESVAEMLSWSVDCFNRLMDCRDSVVAFLSSPLKGKIQ